MIGSNLILVLLLLIAAPSLAAAWEEDVHYGLTKWLALQAGLTETAAEGIAQRNVEADEGILDARHLVFWYACLSKDRNASALVKDYHFPGDADLPSPPFKRVVKQGGPYAFRAVKIELVRKVKSEADQQDSLNRFGKGLHALQDSWSHQGEPGIPWVCDKSLAWGHPSARGGWNSHGADVTRRWPDDTLAAAKATWDVLAAYATAHKSWAAAKPLSDWPSLDYDVKSFATATTKAEKAKWFRVHGFKEVNFLRKISLPDGDEPLSMLIFTLPFMSPVGPPQPLGAVVPREAAQFLQEFWNQWVGNRDYAATVTRFVAVKQLSKAFNVQDPIRNLKFQGDEVAIAQTALAMWRVADHGRVARLGHLPPVPGSPAESEIKNLLGAGLFVLSDGLSQAMLPLGKGGPPLALGPAGGDRYAAFGRFRHAPHDVVMTIAERIDGQWRVTELISVVDH